MHISEYTIGEKYCELLEWWYTYIAADLFHIPVHEKKLGNLLRGPLQKSVH